MVHAKDVIDICESLLNDGIQVWLSGGWGIDALLGEQTRPHKDLDVLLLLDDVVRARERLSRDGFQLKMLWSENRWDVDAAGVETATAFVLQDTAGREFDAHAMRMDAHGNGIPAWEEAEGFIFSPQDLAGEGTIAGYAVQCLSPEAQMLIHRGYELPDEHLRDVRLLQERFGVG
jgi:lincosamide nucleotidyltransferase A/C/D/E